MKCKIYYTSSRGVAEAIARILGEAAGVSPEPLNPAYMPDGVDLMFLGCDGSHPDEAVADFIQALRPERVRYAALFNTNSSLNDRAVERMRDALRARGVRVLENSLICQSRPFQKGLPEFDCAGVADFAAACLREVKRYREGQ